MRCLRVESVSERAELSPQGARQARLARNAGQVRGDNERDKVRCDDKRDGRKKLNSFLARHFSRPSRFSRVSRILAMSVIRFEDLEVWQEAIKLAVDVYTVSNGSYFNQDFSFRDQMRRSAVSIASNIAEGKERETIPEFVRYLYINRLDILSNGVRRI